MVSPQRIIAADRSARVPRIVRALVDLMERQAVVIEVQSGEAALAELERGGVGVVVSGFHLHDMRGYELAHQASQVASDVPVIVLAEAADPVPDDETFDSAPFHHLVLADRGEQVVGMIRAVLDGEPIGATLPEAPPTPGRLSPVPKVDVDELSGILSALLTDVGAMAVVLADRNGGLLAEMGAVGYLDRDRLTGVLAPNFANMMNMGPLVGGDKPSAMHFYDGDEFDIFALAVGLHHFLCLVFEGADGSRAFGAVNMFGRRAVQDMIEVIGEVAFTRPTVEPPAVETRPPTKAKKKKTQEMALPEAEEELPAYVPPEVAKLEPLAVDDTDLEQLLAGADRVDLSAADDIFSPDKLAEIAAKERAGERLTYEEAQQMGVLRK